LGYIWVTKNSALTHKCCIIVLSCSHLKPVENLSIGLKQPNQEPRPSNQSLKALGSRFAIHQPQPADHLEIKLREPITIRSGRMLPSCRGVTACNRYRSDVVGAKGTPRFRAPRLGSRPYTNSAVNSFVASFVWVHKTRTTRLRQYVQRWLLRHHSGLCGRTAKGSSFKWVRWYVTTAFKFHKSEKTIHLKMGKGDGAVVGGKTAICKNTQPELPSV
jgi:hypothetical protein